MLAGIGWQVWLLINNRAASIHQWLPFHRELEVRAMLDLSGYVLMGFEAATAILFLWAGCLLLSSASRSFAARETGNEVKLHESIRSAGKSLIIAVVWVSVVLLAVLALSLWLGWDTAFPPPEAPAEQRVTV